MKWLDVDAAASFMTGIATKKRIRAPYITWVPAWGGLSLMYLIVTYWLHRLRDLQHMNILNGSHVPGTYTVAIGKSVNIAKLAI